MFTTKTEGGYSPSNYTLKRRVNGGAEQTVSVSTDRYSAANYRLTRGVTTPGFKERMRRGDLIPHTAFEQYEQTGQGKYQYDWQVTTYPSSGTREWTTPVAGVAQAAFGPSLAACLEILNDRSPDPAYYVQLAASNLATGGFDALTFLAELRRVISMFLSLGDKLLLLIRTRPPGTAWDLWLEARYGWRTLYLDLKDLEEALSDLDEARSISTERAGSTMTWTDSTISTNTSSPTWTLTTNNTVTYSLGIRGCVAAKIRIPKFQFNPLVTGWELLRFSFVIDWFLSIGSAIGALSFLAMQREYTASYGYLLTADRSTSITAAAKPGYIVNNYLYDVTGHTKLTSRVPTTVSFIPQIKVRLNVTRVIDMVALILQSLNRR
jgi:hypothetical protein